CISSCSRRVMTRGKLSIAVLVVTLLIVLRPALDRDAPKASTHARHAHGAAMRATVTIVPAARPLKIPRSFFGLSTEYWTLPLYERHTDLFERIVSLLQAPDEGPMVLRVGGDSADYSLWE